MIRYLTPSREYRKRLKIYRCCPEIREKMDELSWNFWKAVVIATPVVLALGIPFLIVYLGQLLERWLDRIRLPHWATIRQRDSIMRDIHRILPPQEIRARIEV